MSGLLLEMSLILMLVLANGVFATAEFAIISARRTRLQADAERGSVTARAALRLLRDAGTFLATVQIGITLVGILAGVFGGATIAARLEAQLNTVPWLAPYSDPLAVGIVVLGITFFSVILGELVPKRLALQHPEGFAKALSLPMRGLAVAASPLVWLLSASSNIVLRLLRIRGEGKPTLGLDEIKLMLAQGIDAGVVEQAEREIVERVFRMDEMRIASLATHRSEMVWLDLQKPAEVRRVLIEAPRSVYPVASGSLDNVVGMVRSEALLSSYLSTGGRGDITKVMEPPIFVPDSLNVLRVLELLKPTGMTMALVVDEFGTVQGLVTLKDFWNAIMGGGMTAAHVTAAEEPFVRTPDGSWLVDGQVTVSEFRDQLGLDLSQAEGGEGFDTLGGFIMTHLGRIPATGDTLAWREFEFQVVDMDGNRIDKVRVTPPTADQEEDDVG